MESENSSNSDDTHSNNSSRSVSPENATRHRSLSGSPSVSSHNSAPQSPDNNSSGSQSVGIPSPERDEDLQSPGPESHDSLYSKSNSPVNEILSPEHHNDEPLSPSSASISSSRASSIAGSPERNNHSGASSKASSRSNESDKELKEPRDNYLSDVSDEDSMDNINDDYISQVNYTLYYITGIPC